MHKKRTLFLLILMLLIGGCWAAYSHYTRTLSETELELSGNVDIREVALAFRVGGRVLEVLVDEGDEVTALGQVLARLDPVPLQNALLEAQANLAAAQAQLDLMEAGNRQEDVAQALALLRARQAQLTNAQKMLKRQKDLSGTGAVPTTVYDDARAARDQAAAEVEAARQKYESLNNGFRVEEIEQARAAVQQAQARVAIAQLQLEDAELKASEKGIVITRAIELGSMVNAGTPALSISLRQPVWIRAYVEEPNLASVAPGTKVHIYTDTPGGKTYQGTVGFVSPRSEFTPKQVQTKDLRTGLVYRLRVVVDDADDALRQGMPVTIRLAQEERSPNHSSNHSSKSQP